MGVFATVLYLALMVYMLLLLARLVMDWIRAYARDFRPQGLVLVLFELVYTVSDPPVNGLRRLIPPLRIGSVALDLSLMLLLAAGWFAMRLLAPFVL